MVRPETPYKANQRVANQDIDCVDRDTVRDTRRCTTWMTGALEAFPLRCLPEAFTRSPRWILFGYVELQ